MVHHSSRPDSSQLRESVPLRWPPQQAGQTRSQAYPTCGAPTALSKSLKGNQADRPLSRPAPGLRGVYSREFLESTKVLAGATPASGIAKNRASGIPWTRPGSQEPFGALTAPEVSDLGRHGGSPKRRNNSKYRDFAASEKGFSGSGRRRGLGSDAGVRATPLGEHLRTLPRSRTARSAAAVRAGQPARRRPTSTGGYAC